MEFKIRVGVKLTVILVILANTLFAEEVLLKLLNTELQREMDVLKNASIPAYYIDYRVDDLNYIQIKTSFGSLLESNNDRRRILTTRVKVGDYEFDNTHQNARLSTHGLSSLAFPMSLPIEDSAVSIRQILWESTQVNYRVAKEMYAAVKSVQETGNREKEDGSDFTREVPQKYYEEPLAPFNKAVDVKKWEERLKRYSKDFANNIDIVTAEASLVMTTNRNYFVSTEGASIVQNKTSCNLYIFARIRASDGDVLPLYKTYFAFSPDSLPSEEQILKDIATLTAKLIQLQNAPLAEPFSGPAILNAKAAGVFFHEIFGHRIEGHRMKSESDGQTFLEKINKPVLESSLSVYSNPSLSEFEGGKLNGHYHFDDEGIKGENVTIVEAGILKNFLLSRTPVENFIKSNGHGRTAAGGYPVSRQSNLIIETSKPLAEADLRKKLIKECKKQRKEYGYLFENVEGGFTNTARFTPNAFNIFPTEVYRIYVDGRPDELVRGVNLIGTPLSMFAEVDAAGNKREIFTGMCGAESGSVPVSVVCPSIFVKRIETQKSSKTNLERKILGAPSIGQN
jgi:TldD protein